MGEEFESLKKVIRNFPLETKGIYKTKYPNEFKLYTVYLTRADDTICIGMMIYKKDININVQKLTLYKDIPENKNEYTTLVEAIGLNEEYKHIFDVLKEETQLSKQEIATKLRYETVCRNNDGKHYIFNMEFSANKLYN